MANARTHYNALVEYLVRNREAKVGTLFGKSCLMFADEPFLMLFRDSVAFRLHGRALTSALALRGSQPFDPLNPEKPPPGRPGWVLVPASQFVAWDRLAMDSMRCVRVARDQNVSWKPAPPPPEPVAAPPTSTPASLAQRVASALANGLLSKLTFLR